MSVLFLERLEEKLREDNTYDGYIRALLNNTKPPIAEKADFFPEYTIH